MSHTYDLRQNLHHRDIILLLCDASRPVTAAVAPLPRAVTRDQNIDFSLQRACTWYVHRTSYNYDKLQMNNQNN